MPDPRVVRFGSFEFDATTGELWHDGRHVRLQEQPRRVLQLLLERPGELVTREALRRALWSEDTFVEADAGLNVAINKIRQALGDSASSPRYVETLPRRGYRFIAPVTPPARDEDELPRRGETDSGVSKEAGATGDDAAVGRRWRGARQAGVVAGLILSIAAGLAAALYFPRTTAPQEPLRAVPITSLPGLEYSPAVSPDGSRVAFLGAPAGDWAPRSQLYVQALAAATPLQLTNGPGDVAQPTWSPDGTQLAFLRHTGQGAEARHQVVLMPATGGAERQLATLRGGLHGLSWSPDGRFLAVADVGDEGAPEAIHLLSIATGETERLTTPPADHVGDCFPSFSPDGRQLAFARLRTPGRGDIGVLDLATRTVTRVVSDENIYSAPDWTEDGGRLVFAGGDSIDFQRLWTVPATGGTARPVEVGDGYAPSTSRRNGVLVYVRVDTDWNIWRVAGPALVDRAAEPRRLIESTHLDYGARYSPDGGGLAFVSRQSGHPEVWTSRSDGTQPVRLTSLGNDDIDIDLTWSPDGRQLAFTSSAEGSHEIYLVADAGGRPVRLTSTSGAERWPSFSRDGRWIYFSMRTGDSLPQVWRMPREGGSPVQVTRHGGVRPLESPDGRFVYFTKGRAAGLPGIWRMPVEGGGEERVVEHGDPHNWDLSPNFLCYIVATSMPSSSVECLDISSKTARRLANIPKPPLRIGLSISPDERWMLVTLVDRNESDLMMVEGFR